MRSLDKKKMDPRAEDHGHALTTGDKLLHGQYTIQCYLSSGGFGVTYLARDSLNRQIVIKECFPVLTCHRQGKRVTGRTEADQEMFKDIVRHLLHEARRMARLNHPNIVGVHQVFEENGTAYLALDFVNGLDLLEIIERNPKRLTPDVIKKILVKTLDAIEYMHECDILHRDISPDNILITEDNEPVLIDFGAAREVTDRASKALSTINAVKEGYSPLEFYSSGTEQTTASDLYSLGASFYHVITKVPPPDSLSRLSAVAADEPDPLEPIPVRLEGYDRYFLSAIDHAMTLFPKDRMQTAKSWLDQIDQERRQKALLAAAHADRGMEALIKELTDATNDALNAALAEKQAEEAKKVLEERAAEQQEAQQPDKPMVAYDYFGDVLDNDMNAEEWDNALANSDNVDEISSEKQKRNKSLLGSLMSLRGSLFASKDQSIEAEP